MRKITSLLLALFPTLLLISTPLSCNLFKGKIQDKGEFANDKHEYYKVLRVIDGDTFVIDDGSKKGTKVRLIGVDAPESRKTGKKEIGYYGKEAKDFMTTLLTDKKVRLEYDVNKYDQYLRLLAYVYLEDGTFINEYLIKHGYAMVMTVPPNVKYSEYFLKCQQEARIKSKGLWGRTVENEVQFN